jgi:hypothetical protein
MAHGRQFVKAHHLMQWDVIANSHHVLADVICHQIVFVGHPSYQGYRGNVALPDWKGTDAIQQIKMAHS